MRRKRIEPPREKDKALIWRSKDIKFPLVATEARLEAEALLRRALKGEKLERPNARALRNNMGDNVYELNVITGGSTLRIVYRAMPDAVLLMDAYLKKSAVTPDATIALCQKAMFTAMTIYNENGREGQEELLWARLEAAGFQRGTAREFLELPPEADPAAEAEAKALAAQTALMAALDPEVAAVFRDAASVNAALRFLIRVTRENAQLVAMRER